MEKPASPGGNLKRWSYCTPERENLSIGAGLAIRAQTVRLLPLLEKPAFVLSPVLDLGVLRRFGKGFRSIMEADQP